MSSTTLRSKRNGSHFRTADGGRVEFQLHGSAGCCLSIALPLGTVSRRCPNAHIVVSTRSVCNISCCHFMLSRVDTSVVQKLASGMLHQWRLRAQREQHKGAFLEFLRGIASCGDVIRLETRALRIWKRYLLDQEAAVERV